MLGVVVWADEALSKAIVWCEDQGDLAYIAMSAHHCVDATQFGAGDLIQFDLAEHENLRVAENPKRIAQHYCSEIGEVVRTAKDIKSKKQGNTSTASAAKPTRTSDVIDLAAWRARHRPEKISRIAT